MYRHVIAAIVALAASGSAHAALTVETAPFITTVANFNSFETMGLVSAPDVVKNHNEDGIAVAYIGIGNIWSYSQPAFDGLYSWTPDGFGEGYTRISFDDATKFQFAAGSTSAWPNPPVYLLYKVFLDGSPISEGMVGELRAAHAGFDTYGFSGATFDEIWVRASWSQFWSNDTNDELTLDALAVGRDIIEPPGRGVPDPASWMTMIAGLGLVGISVRRRRGASVVIA
jgi:hypothetical protein